MTGKKRLVALLITGICTVTIVSWRDVPTERVSDRTNPHLRSGTPDSLFEGSNSMFSSAGTCDHCHGADPAALASVDMEGNDVNLVDDWSSTIMSQSARDPFWRAKVSHEVFVNPQLQQEIESTCTRCHAPLGNFAAQGAGQEHYSIAEMLIDSVALDGVSCLACHRQIPQSEVATHSGHLHFDPNQIAYGPFDGPLVTPMALYSGYVPELGSHINDAKLCAGCHSLVTHTVDLSGVPTGDEFVEQATWHEWLNSSYSDNGTTCQSCHLPRLNKQGIILAAGFDTPPREPFGLHTLAGGNSLMLSILRDNSDELGIVTADSQFDETIAATLDNLQQKSLMLSSDLVERTEDTIYVDVKLTNITGHKLPSGYPSRRVSVQLVLTDDMGSEIFRSGGFNSEYFIPSENNPFEPHYQIIKSESEVQIYEMVMGDVSGNETTILERAYSHLKDNRLVPLGFSEADPQYDTTAIVLGGVTDPDFNYDLSEGSGSDIIHYHIPSEGYTGAAHVAVEVYYQSLPPVWMEELFATSTPQIDTWHEMYTAADRSPVLMRATELSIPGFVGIEDGHEPVWSLIPQPESLAVITGQPGQLVIYDMQGREITGFRISGSSAKFNHSLAAGYYIAVYTDVSGQSYMKKFRITH